MALQSLIAASVFHNTFHFRTFEVKIPREWTWGPSACWNLNTVCLYAQWAGNGADPPSSDSMLNILEQAHSAIPHQATSRQVSLGGNQGRVNGTNTDGNRLRMAAKLHLQLSEHVAYLTGGEGKKIPLAAIWIFLSFAILGEGKFSLSCCCADWQLLVFITLLFSHFPPTPGGPCFLMVVIKTVKDYVCSRNGKFRLCYSPPTPLSLPTHLRLCLKNYTTKVVNPKTKKITCPEEWAKNSVEEHRWGMQKDPDVIFSTFGSSPE